MGGLIGFIGDLKVLWKEWDVRSFIVASFVFQLILIVIAPFRKRSSSLFVRIGTWLSYLLADWVAAQAVGLIARATQGSRSQESDLFGLWAQFLLLHLGGPDTISALALQDNELWLRTALHLGTQAYATLGILVRSVRHSTLWAATVLIFVVGVIKYIQRIASLHHGLLSDIDDDPYEKYMTKLPITDDGDEEKGKTLSKASMVRGSYLLFQAYKSLYSELPLKRDVRATARKYFLKRTPEEAYKMVAIHINFMYEAMYTKMAVMHKTSWWLLHHVAFWLQVASFVIWCMWDKRGFHSYDVCITYALLIGAIVVDLIGFVRINRSDWNIALSKKEPKVLQACGYIGSWLLDVYESRAPQSMRIGRYDGCSSYDCFDKAAMCLRLPLVSEHKRRELKFDSDKVYPIWNFIYEMLTKRCERACYELPAGSINMNEMLRRAFPIHVLAYNNILQYWYSVKHREKDLMFKCIAEYLVYLIVFQPDMMFAAAGKGRVVTLQKQSIFLNMYLVDLPENTLASGEVELPIQEEDADDRNGMEDTFGLLTLEPNMDKAMVDEAIRQLIEVKKYVVTEQKGEILDRVWGEMLCHAAITCRPSIHAAKLKEGGEFLSYVWLLLVHLRFEARSSS